MHHKGKLILFVCVVVTILLMPCVASSEINSNLPDLGEPYEQEVTFDQIRSAFANGHYDLAFNLCLESAYIKARQALLDEKNLKIIITKAAEKLQEIINRPDLTDEEKGEEAVKIIVATLEPYEYMVSDALNTSIKHSIEYGATFISWDDKTAFTQCWGWYLNVEVIDCDAPCDPFVYTWEYRADYLTQVPDYSVYRIINGNQKLLAKVKGYKHIKQNTFGLSLDDGWTDLASNAFDFYRDIPEATIEEGRRFWIDLHSDVRNKGETLSYRVVANLEPYKANSCGSNDMFSSTISADADGDGKMDYIPTNEYDKYFGKYYGWLIPTIALLN